MAGTFLAARADHHPVHADGASGWSTPSASPGSSEDADHVPTHARPRPSARRRSRLAAAAAAATRPAGRSRSATACGTPTRQPVYQKCADAFQQQNPNIKIQIETKNWGDYWSGLARGFIADTAPDVFTDHLAKYPQFAQSQVIEPLDTERAST